VTFARSTFFATNSGRPGFITTRYLEALNEEFETASVERMLKWCLDMFESGVSLGTSFGPSGLMMMDIALKIAPDIDIYFLDTMFLFPETHAQIARAEQHFGRTFRQVKAFLTIEEQEAQYGPNLYYKNPTECCKLRKVYTQIHALRDSRVWITAIRRDQSPTRADTPFVSWNDRFNVVKVSPMAKVTGDEVWDYIRAHNLPYNELHDHGYPSIGCWPCTQPVVEGEDERSGRWQGLDKTECGLQLDEAEDVVSTAEKEAWKVYSS